MDAAQPDEVAELPAMPVAAAAEALRATQRTRQRLIENTNPQLAIEVLMLDLPHVAGAEHGEEARAAAALAS